MSPSLIIFYFLFIAAIIIMNIWHRKDRSKMTYLERRIDDEEMKRELQIW